MGIAMSSPFGIGKSVRFQKFEFTKIPTRFACPFHSGMTSSVRPAMPTLISVASKALKRQCFVGELLAMHKGMINTKTNH